MVSGGGASSASVALLCRRGRAARRHARSRNAAPGRVRGINAPAPASAAVASRPQMKTARAWPESSSNTVASAVAVRPVAAVMATHRRSGLPRKLV